MLLYLGSGERDYGRHAFAPYQRKAWEFQAVIKGQIGVLTPEKAHPLHSRQLWIFPPGHNHGWIGKEKELSEVTVFHFTSVPELLIKLLGKKEFLEIPLTAATAHRLGQLATQVGRYWRHPAPGGMLCYEQALLELTVLACEANARLVGKTQNDFAAKKVDAAILWYMDRLEENPGLPEVARAVGLSVAHLRRLFEAVLDASPKHIMDQARFQRAMHLMSDRTIKLETVSEKCGFGSASAFSRAFKDKFGCSPASWRA